MVGGSPDFHEADDASDLKEIRRDTIPDAHQRPPNVERSSVDFFFEWNRGGAEDHGEHDQRGLHNAENQIDFHELGTQAAQGALAESQRVAQAGDDSGTFQQCQQGATLKTQLTSAQKKKMAKESAIA